MRSEMLNGKEIEMINALDMQVNWKYRPIIALENFGEIKVAPVMAQPGSRAKSYWAQHLVKRNLVFAETPSIAVWQLLRQLKPEAPITATCMLCNKPLSIADGPEMHAVCEWQISRVRKLEAA